VTNKYHKGTIPIPDSKWKVYTIAKDGISFKYLGEIFVSGKTVSKEMDARKSIKGYEPYDIAKQIAHKKFPKANPIEVERIWE